MNIVHTFTMLNITDFFDRVHHIYCVLASSLPTKVARIEPILPKVEQVPKAEVLTSVGNNSAVYK